MILNIGILFLAYLKLSLQIQNRVVNITSANNNQRQFYQMQLQFQYRPDLGGNWQSWSSPTYSAPPGSLVGHGSATSIQFPGPVNNIRNISTSTNSNKNTSAEANVQNQNSRDKNQNSGVRLSNQCKCGIVPPKTLERITGGTVSKESAWPWMAAIVYIGSETPFWFCGASLINDRYLITAAHCQKTIKRRGIANIRVLMGTNGIPSKANANELFEISELRTHPMYKPNIEDFDIGLIRLKNKVTFSSKISPICLTQRGSPFLDRMATVAGWGSITYGDNPPDTLREVEIKVVTNPSCQREYMYHYGTRITPAMLCAWLPGKDSCQGDSGGPLFLKTTTDPEVYTQIGVVSFGPPQCGETTIPGVYTRVASTIRWIKANTRDATYCTGAF